MAIVIQNSVSDEPIYRESTLKYVVPSVPPEYLDNDRPPPEFNQISMCRENRYTDGNDLFRSAHRSGWEGCRRQFYRDGYDGFDWDAQFEHLNDKLPSDTWVYAHQFNAVTDGRTQCKNAIRHLLNEYSESKLRESICYSRIWRIIPSSIIAIAALALMLRSKLRSGN